MRDFPKPYDSHIHPKKAQPYCLLCLHVRTLRLNNSRKITQLWSDTDNTARELSWALEVMLTSMLLWRLWNDVCERYLKLQGFIILSVNTILLFFKWIRAYGISLHRQKNENTKNPKSRESEAGGSGVQTQAGHLFLLPTVLHPLTDLSPSFTSPFSPDSGDHYVTLNFFVISFFRLYM